jgi:uncharacterized protein (UPF0276 family)
VDFDKLLALPALGVGLLLNPDTLGQDDPDPAYQFLEVIPDRFWLDAGPGTSVPDGARFRELRPSVRALDELAERVPLIGHSIGLSIGSASCFDREHVEKIGEWQRRYRFAWHSDHLAFSRLGEHGVEVNAAVTLPLTRDDESLQLLCGRVVEVIGRVPVPFLLENNVYFVQAPDEPYRESEFLNELCRRSGCGLLLDLHNLLVNARHHGFACEEVLDELDLRQVVEIHIAGGDELHGFYTDSHAGPVAAEVWPLLERTLRAAPWIRAVTFEYHESYAGVLGEGGLARELRRAQRIWDRCC